MARRKWVPAVARPTKRQRAVELGKDLLILALTCSAAFLAWQTPLASQVRGWMAEPVQLAEPAARQQTEAVRPYALAVRNSMGLYGVSYDEELVDRSFERLSDLLGEGLATAGAPENTTRRQWQALLESPGVYCVFQGKPPLSVLSEWLGGGGGLTGNAQALVLAWDGDRVWLCWRDGDSYRRAATAVAYQGNLDAALGEFSPNGASYAYVQAKTDRTYETLDPYVLTTLTAPQPQEYTAASPDLVGDRAALEQVLSSLGFQSGVDFAYEAAGDLAINENGDRLRVNSTGRLIFHAGEEVRYAAPCEGEAPTAAEAAGCAWDLLNRVTGPWKGDGSYVLTGVEETGKGWTVTFRARLGGVPVWTGETGEAASFTVKGRGVSDFSITLRGYTGTGTATVVPGERLAAAALHSLPDSGDRLILRYGDSAGGKVTAGWVVEE